MPFRRVYCAGKVCDRQGVINMKHLTIEEILAYIAGNISEEESFRVDHHLADCRECVGRVHAYGRMRENFDDLWESWTVKDHAREMLKAHIIASAASAKIAPELRKRLSLWLKHIGEKTEAALDIVMDSSRRTANILQESMEGLVRPGGARSFELVPSPVRTLGTGETGSISLEARLPAWIRVTVDPAARKIAVQGPGSEETLPLAILVPQKRGEALVEEFRRPEDADFILAEFEDLPDGEYFLLLESVI